MSDHESNNTSALSPRDQPEASPMIKTPKANKKTTSIELTPVEGLLFYNIVRFNNDTSAVDWDQVAIHSNLKNAASAKVRFRQIQKKYDLENLPSAKATPKPPSVQKGGSRKRKAVANVEDGDDGVADEPASKKKPARKRNGAISGNGNSKAKGKDQNAANGTDDDAGDSDDELTDRLVKKEPGIHHGANAHVTSFAGAHTLSGANENINADTPIRDVPSFPHGLNFYPNQDHTQPAPHGGIRPAQQLMQQQPNFGRTINPAFLSHGYHMAGGQFGQLEGDPAGFFGPPASTLVAQMQSAAHGLPKNDPSRQQTDSPRSAQFKKEETEGC